MSYKYRPSYKPHEDRDRGESLNNILKKLRKIANAKTSTILILLIAIFIVYGGSRAITGFITYRETLEQNLLTTEEKLANMTKLYNETFKNLTQTETELNNYKTSLSKKESELSECISERDDYNTCEEEINECVDDYRRKDNDDDWIDDRDRCIVNIDECDDDIVDTLGMFISDVQHFWDKWNNKKEDYEKLKSDYDEMKTNYIKDKCCAGYSGSTIYWKLDDNKILCQTNSTSGYTSYSCP